MSPERQRVEKPRPRREKEPEPEVEAKDLHAEVEELLEHLEELDDDLRVALIEYVDGLEGVYFD